MNRRTTHPPALARKFLQMFLREELAEEVSGDLEEQFQRKAGQSLFRARVEYWYQVLHYLRPFAIRKSRIVFVNQAAMYQSYFIIGWRNLVRYKMYSFIKIAGFAIGIAACLLIAMFVRHEVSYDNHYQNGDRIFRVLGVLEGEQYKDVAFSAPFVNAIREDYPEIEKAGRYNAGELFGAGSNEIRRADKTENAYEEGFAYMDQSLLEILEVPMVYGRPQAALSEPNSIVISKSRAEKYFPGENPVGKLFIVGNDDKRLYKVGGVMKDFPPTSHVQFNFLISMTGREFWPGEQSSWTASNYPTYVLLKPGVDPVELARKMTKGVIEKYVLPSLLEGGVANARELVKKARIELQPVRDIYLSTEVYDRLPHHDLRFIWLFGAIGSFILIIACINFVNLSTARSAGRAKEVGLRKVVGAERSGVIRQFLTESILFSFFSFVTGIFLAWALLPYFNHLSSRMLTLPWTSWWFIPGLFAAAVLVGFVSGIYPAFYLSSFSPAQVLKGNVSRGTRGSFTRNVLVVFQFTTSIVLIAGTFVIYRQMEFILGKKLGFDKEQVLMVQGANTLKDEIHVFKKELQRLPEIKHVSISDYLPVPGTKRNGNGFWKEGRQKLDDDVSAQIWRVDEDYVETMGMTILEGRNFSREIASDSQAVIINQTMARQLGLENPVGEKIQNWEVYTVIALVEDFHFESLKQNIEPLAMVLGNSPNIVSLKITSSDMNGAIASVERVWKAFAPHQPFRYDFLDQTYARMYDDVARTGKIFTSCALLAIIVACLGLFALSAFMVEQRGKEISIRVVLGASVNNIFGLLTFSFLKLVLISFVVAVPLAYYLMQEWLKQFAYRTGIHWDIFLIAGAIAFTIAVVTLSYQSLTAAMENPVRNLKSE